MTASRPSQANGERAGGVEERSKDMELSVDRAPWKDGTMSENIEVPIRDSMIRLGQLLKLAGVVENGAVARDLIAEGAVLVDGLVETRRGAQIRPGQTVEFHGEDYGLPQAVLSVTAED
jgi:ribosome-associated protein